MTLRVELLMEDGSDEESLNSLSGLMAEHQAIPRAGDVVAGRRVVGVEWVTGGYDPVRPMLAVRVTLEGPGGEEEWA